MTLLGKPVDDLRRMQPKRRFSTVTTLRIGIQLIKVSESFTLIEYNFITLKAFTCLHKAGFIHRDVKPANMAAGHKRPDIIYLFDFGLARFIYIDEAKSMLRPRRKKVKIKHFI